LTVSLDQRSWNRHAKSCSTHAVFTGTHVDVQNTLRTESYHPYLTTN